MKTIKSPDFKIIKVYVIIIKLIYLFSHQNLYFLIKAYKMSKGFSNYIKKQDNEKCPFNDQKFLISDTGKPIIFDLGANKGQSALKYAQTFSKSKIYSFEPYLESYNILISKTAEYKNITAFQYAVSNRNTLVKLHVNKKKTTNSLLEPSAEGKYWANKPTYMNTIETKEVCAFKLDTFCKKNNIEKIDILKMDVQGAELLALKGAAGLLKKGAIKIIFTEVSFVKYYEGGVLFNTLYEKLSSLGFVLYDLYDMLYASNGQIRRADALFINKKLSHKLFEIQKENIETHFDF
jgi:FkbM family methyltransferase